MIKWMCVIFSVCVVVSSSSYAVAEDLIIGVISMDAPLLYGTENGTQEGWFVDFAAELTQRLSLSVTIEVIPRKRIVEYALEGKVHLFGLINPQWLPDTKDQFDWSLPISTNRSWIITHQDRKITTYDDLNGLTLGCRLGFNYVDELMEKFRTGKAVREDVPTEIQNYKKLFAKRVDAVVSSSSHMAQYYLYTIPEYQDTFRINSLVLSTVKQYLAISKHSPVSVDALNQVLSQMTEDGTMRRLFHKYGIDDFE